MKTTIQQLEDWIYGYKARCCSLEIDNGYGATCWRIKLFQGKNFVECHETTFVGQEGVDDSWIEKDGNLFTCVVSGDDLDGDWPGLEKTILHALNTAEKFFGNG